MTRTTILLAVTALLLATPPVDAQKNCVKGKPCGNACIARNKTCRIETPRRTPSPRPTATPAADPASEAAPARTAVRWVASSRGTVYYREGCSGARQLSRANLIYFASEAEAREGGYRKSKQKGC